MAPVNGAATRIMIAAPCECDNMPQSRRYTLSSFLRYHRYLQVQTWILITVKVVNIRQAYFHHRKDLKHHSPIC